MLVRKCVELPKTIYMYILLVNVKLALMKRIYRLRRLSGMRIYQLNNDFLVKHKCTMSRLNSEKPTFFLEYFFGIKIGDLNQ